MGGYWPPQRAFEAADTDRYNVPADISDAEYEKLDLASRGAWASVEQSWVDDEPFSDSRRESVAVFVALAHVGRQGDGHGLAQVAVGAVAPYGEREDGRTWGSDAIRRLRRLPGFGNPPVEGPDAPTAAAARAAAQTPASQG